MSRIRMIAAALAAGACCTATPPAVAAPTVRAPSAILVEPATGDIVFQRRADQRRPIASATKLMTALVVLERTSLSDVMRAVPYSALAVESRIGLRAGERMTVADLLRALLLESANDAAATLAVRVAGSRSRFVELMNRRARELGLRDTRFANPIGFDSPRNHSTATDLVKLTLILRRREFFRATVDRARVTLRSGARPRTLPNRNTLVRRHPFVDGVKTGHTLGAGYVLVGSGTRDGVTLISAVLGAPSDAARNADTLALLRHGLSRYRVQRALRRGQVLARAKLEHRDEHVDLVAAAPFSRVARRGERLAVTVSGAPQQIDGPLAAGARVGTVTVRHRGKVVARVGLITAREVDAATFLQRLGAYAGRSSTVLLLGGFALCSLYLVLLRRRAVRRSQARRGGPEVA